MSNTIVIGMQWGDEGKGKEIDILSESHKLMKISGRGKCRA